MIWSSISHVHILISKLVLVFRQQLCSEQQQLLRLLQQSLSNILARCKQAGSGARRQMLMSEDVTLKLPFFCHHLPAAEAQEHDRTHSLGAHRLHLIHGFCTLEWAGTTHYQPNHYHAHTPLLGSQWDVLANQSSTNLSMKREDPWSCCVPLFLLFYLFSLLLTIL